MLVILLKSKNDKKHKIAPKKRKGGKIVAYAVMRFQKYKIGELGKIERHNNDRSHLKSRVHPELEYLNRTAKHQTKTLTQQIREKIKQIKTEKGKTTRKDAAVVAEFVLTFSPEKTEDIMKRKKEWVKANTEWIKETFQSRGAKLLRFDFHMDETTPHLHAFVQMTDERGLFSASRFFGKKKQLEELQTSYAKAMEPFGLERGRSKKETKAKHQTLNEYYKHAVDTAEEFKKIENEVKIGIEKLKEDSERIKAKQEELQDKEKEIDEIKNTILGEEKKEKEVGYYESEIADDLLL